MKCVLLHKASRTAFLDMKVFACTDGACTVCVCVYVSFSFYFGHWAFCGNQGIFIPKTVRH